SAPASCPSEAEAAPAADRDSAVSSEYSENRCGAGQNEVSASAVLSPSASSPEPPPSPVPEEPSLSAASPPAGVGAANGAVDGWAAAAELSPAWSPDLPSSSARVVPAVSAEASVSSPAPGTAKASVSGETSAASSAVPPPDLPPGSVSEASLSSSAADVTGMASVAGESSEGPDA